MFIYEEKPAKYRSAAAEYTDRSPQLRNTSLCKICNTDNYQELQPKDWYSCSDLSEQVLFLEWKCEWEIVWSV